MCVRMCCNQHHLQAYVLLNCDDHASYLRKHKKDPALYRPDICHQVLGPQYMHTYGMHHCAEQLGQGAWQRGPGVLLLAVSTGPAPALAGRTFHSIMPYQYQASPLAATHLTIQPPPTARTN